MSGPLASDNDLIRALEVAGDDFSARGNAACAARAHRVAGTLRFELKEYQDAVDEVTRCRERVDGHGTLSEEGIALYFAEAVRQERWASVIARREQGIRFLKKPR